MNTFIDRFIAPQVLSGAPDLVHRTRLGLAFAWVSAVLFLVGAVTQAVANNFAAVTLDVVCAIALVGSSLLVKRTGNLALATHTVLGLIFVAVMVLAIEVRGAGLSGATLMLAVIPLFATLICGSRHGWAWLAISLSAGLVLGLLGHAGRISDHLTPLAHLFNDHLVLVIFTVVLFTVGRIYENRRDEAQRHISELETQRHLAELGHLRAHAAAELAKVEQLASLGRVAAAAAHEINNPLAYLMSSIEFARANRAPEDAGEVQAALAEAAEGASRINRIVRDLGTAARPSSESITRVNVTESLQAAIELARPHTASRAEVRTRYAEVPLVTACAPRLTQVFLNLLLNACQSLPEGRPSEQEISVEVRSEGSQVCVEISHSAEAGPRGADGSLAVILGAAVVNGFEGKLTIEAAEGRTIARVTLASATPG